MAEPERELLYYAPGDTTLVVAPGCAVLVGLAATDDLVSRILDRLRSTLDVDEVLEILVAPGLRAVKHFAVAQWTAAGTRVVVRGDFVGEVRGGTDVVGRGLWTDRFIDAPATVTLRSGGESPVSLPLGLGVVRAEAVALRSVDAVEAEQPGHPDSAESKVPAAAPAAPAPATVAAALAPAAPVPVEVAAELPVPVPVVAELPVPAFGFTPAEAESGAVLPAAPDHQEPSPAGRFVEALEAPVAWQPVPFEPPAPARGPVSEPLSAPAPAAGGIPVPDGSADADGGLLIEFFPWATNDEEPWNPAPSAGVPAGARRASPPTPPPPMPAYDPEAAEMTVDRRNLVGHIGPSDTLVVAARCPQGHLSPAYAGGCRVCGQALPAQQPFETPRPPLGVLRLSNGDVVTLDRGLILGRNPRLPAGFTGDQPNLLKLNDPGKDISSQHLEVSLDFWHVLVKDLGSTNGTEVILPGEPPVQLRANDPMMIEPGTRVVLAGVLDFVFEVTG